MIGHFLNSKSIELKLIKRIFPYYCNKQASSPLNLLPVLQLFHQETRSFKALSGNLKSISRMDELTQKLNTYIFLQENNVDLNITAKVQSKQALSTAAPAEKAKQKKDTSKTKDIQEGAPVSDKLDRPLVPAACEETLKNVHDQERFYLTTAINYTNGLPHLGHAYEAITSDIIVRYHRLFGRKTFFLTGTDEHGQKVEASAIAQNKTPQQVADFYADKFKKLDNDLRITYDGFIRTTDAVHEKNCELLWNNVFEKGDIYLKDYVGWYDVHSEKYVTDFEAEQSDYKDEYGRPYEKKSEESYFFRQSKYQEQLLKHIKENPSFIQPDTRKHEILSFLKDPLQDLCVSRTVCQWGVKCPGDDNYKGDKKHVMYVWFDALTNYLSGIEYLSNPGSDLTKFWPVNVHIIGKDIIRFHCVIWPCMLLAAGIPLPKSVFGHGFVQDKNGIKMSKSLGNVVDPVDMITKYNVDCFRLYLAHETTYGADLAFNEESMVALYNSFLSSGYGNLVHRSTSLCKAYCDGLIPDVEPYKYEGKLPFDLDDLRNQFEKSFSIEGGFQLHTAGEALIIAVNSSNKYLQDCAPWKLKGDEHDEARKAIVRSSLECIYALSHFIEIFCPVRIGEVYEKLGVKQTLISKLKSDFKNLVPGTRTYVGDVLYEQIIVETEEALIKEKTQNVPKSKEENPAPSVSSSNLTLVEKDDLFYKIEIRVGKIVDVWHHPEADGLFCEKIDIGEGQPREIASGLRKFYDLEDLKDRKVLVICNLKAANLKGFKSNGMVLCAAINKGSNDERVEFCEPPPESEIGERIVITLENGRDLKPEEVPEPAAPNTVTKKKIFQQAAEYLKTNDNAEGTFDGRVLKTLKTQGVCKAKTLRGAPLS